MDDSIETHPDLMNPDWQKHAERDAWLGSKQERKQFKKQQKRTRRPRNGRRWGLIAFFAILAVTTAVVVYLGRTPHDDAYTPPTTVNPTSVAQVAHIDLAHPYAHTPAELWKKGSDGITAPAAAPIGTFKADAVADAYAKVKQAVIGARLDPVVLVQHDTKGYLALFAPDMQDTMRPVLATPRKGDGTPNFASYVNEVADGYHLLEDGTRSMGTITARAGERPGELVLDVKYVIAYAFDNVHPEQLTDPEEIVSFFRSDESYIVRAGSGFAKSSHGLWLQSGDGAFSSGGCDAAKQGLLAPGYANANITGTGDGSEEGPGYYDPQYPVPNLDTCPK